MIKSDLRRSLLTHPITRRTRSVARQFGLTKLVSRALQPADYEVRFSKTLLSALQPGDVVWDVGANLGHYTALFADIVGDAGRVVAFEPTADTFARLSAALAGRSNITLLNEGLSDADGIAEIIVGDDAIAATSRVASTEANTAPADAERREKIALTRAATVIAEERAPKPNVIKVDVEGHEWKVIAGLDAHLRDTDLRRVLIEVHFGILDSDGRAHEVDQIDTALRNAGFDISWTDASHVDAKRHGA